jgi:hypothetical protein
MLNWRYFLIFGNPFSNTTQDAVVASPTKRQAPLSKNCRFNRTGKPKTTSGFQVHQTRTTKATTNHA